MNRRNLVRVLLGLTLVAVAALAAALGIGPAAADRLAALRGPLGGLGAVVLITGLSLVLVPRGLYAAAAGATFGLPAGFSYALVGGLLGAMLAFGIGRALGAEGLRRFGNGRWARADEWLGQHGFTAVLTARLLPVLPGGLLNYAFGTTSVRFVVYCPATLLGIIPSTLAYALVGRHALGNPMAALALAGGATLLTAASAAVFRRRAQMRAAHAPTDSR